MIKGGFAVCEILETNPFLPAPVDPNRKKVAGKGFSPGNLSPQKGMFEGAFGNPVFSHHEYAGFLPDAGCDVAPGGTFKKPLPGNGIAMFTAEMRKYCGEGFPEFVDFAVEERGSASSGNRTTCPLTSLYFTSESQRGNSRINCYFVYFNQFVHLAAHFMVSV